MREPSPADKQVCPVCQITFLEFRNSGRLGCPYDYEVFRDELMLAALENIHGEKRVTRARCPAGYAAEHAAADDPDPAPQRAEAAVAAEDYEAAAAEGPVKGIEQEQGR